MRVKLLLFLALLSGISSAICPAVAYGKYEKRVNVGSVEILIEQEQKSQLLGGKALNRYFSGFGLTAVVFDRYENYPEMRGRWGIDVGEYGDGASEEDRVRLYYRGSAAYVLSEHTISAGSCEEMFKDCYTLGSVEFNNFDAGGVKSMKDMFANCIFLNRLTMDFDTSAVTDMSGMFRNCVLLQSLDLGGFQTSSVEDMSDMFRGCRSLARVYVSESWSVERVLSGENMFKDCTRLTGGNGTRYGLGDSFVYAKIDEADSPGYFTGK